MLIINGKRVYSAINIYAWDENYQDIIEQAKILNDLKVDGIIVSDGGVVDAIKEAAPDTEIHISTQANTISYHSSNFWYKNGAKRVILGREMSKEQIKVLMENKPEDEFANYWLPRIVQITDRYLGKGMKVAQCSRDQVEALDLIVSDLKELIATKPTE